MFFLSLLYRISSRWPMLVYAATWTTLLTFTVAVASFAPEFAFVRAVSATSSAFSKACKAEEGSTMRVPLDIPGEIICLPAHQFIRSNIDFVVPPVFAAIVVAASACVVRAMALWEDHDPLPT